MDAQRNVNSYMRLVPTTVPYMIKDHFQDYVANQKCPTQKDVYEITRFCSLTYLSNIRGRNQDLSVAGNLAAAAIEYGLTHGIRRYIALTNMPVKKMITNAGWDPKPMGPVKITPDNLPSVVCDYTVSKEMLNDLRMRHNINHDVLYDIKNPGKSLMEIWNDNTTHEATGIFGDFIFGTKRS